MPTRALLLQALRGFLMGAADIVPGVSGGTVALVLGIYTRLIKAIHTGVKAVAALLRGRLRDGVAQLGEVPWTWLVSLLVGIGVAIATMSSLLEGLLADHPQAMAGLFFGLVAASALVAWRLVRATEAHTIGIMLASAVAFFLLLGLRGATAGAPEQAPQHGGWVFFLAGSLAICAMVLPGISGSFVLLLLGLYPEVLGAVNERNLPLLGVFVLGCIVGLAIFASLLAWLLERAHDVVLAALIGLMVGSLRVLWPWPDGLATTSLGAPGQPLLGPVLLALGGCAVVLGLEAAARRFKHADRH